MDIEQAKKELQNSEGYIELLEDTLVDILKKYPDYESKKVIFCAISMRRACKIAVESLQNP